MVMDFGDLKAIVNEQIVNRLDHALLLNKKAENSKFDKIPEIFDKTLLVAYQPTCENMVSDFAERIKKELPKTVELHSIKLHETATSFAEWYAADQEA